jgi:hypothetical protein
LFERVTFFSIPLQLRLRLLRINDDVLTYENKPMNGFLSAITRLLTYCGGSFPLLTNQLVEWTKALFDMAKSECAWVRIPPRDKFFHCVEVVFH